MSRLYAVPAWGLVLLDGIVANVMKELGETETSMRGRHAIMV